LEIEDRKGLKNIRSNGDILKKDGKRGRTVEAGGGFVVGKLRMRRFDCLFWKRNDNFHQKEDAEGGGHNQKEEKVLHQAAK